MGHRLVMELQLGGDERIVPCFFSKTLNLFPTNWEQWLERPKNIIFDYYSTVPVSQWKETFEDLKIEEGRLCHS